jgi:CHAT domain-containing protein
LPITQLVPVASLPELEDKISHYHGILSSTPRPHPERSDQLHNLAGLLSSRFDLSDEKGDLDKCILYLTEAILLPHLPLDPPGDSIVQMLFDLASILLRRSQESEQPEDVQSSVIYFRYLRDHFQSIETFDISRAELATYLVVALSLKVELGIGDAMEDIQEMTVLCRELLDPDLSKDYPMEAIMPFSGAVITEFEKRDAKEPSEEVIEVLRSAAMAQPDVIFVSFALARCLCTRFQISFAINDYEEVMPILDRIIASHSPGSDLSTMEDSAILMIVALVLARTNTYYPTPEDLENSIYRLRGLLSIPFLEDSHRSTITDVLGSYDRKRFEYFGVTGSLVESHPSGPNIVARRSLSPRPGTLEWITAGSGSNEDPEDERTQLLHELLPAICNNEVPNIDEAVKYARTLSSSSHSDDQHPSIPIYYFAHILLESFKRGHNVEYLDEAITTFRNVLGMPNLQRTWYLATRGLLISLAEHVQLPGHKRHKQDLDEMMQLYPELVNNQFVRVSVRFEFSCTWARNARHFKYPPVSVAYENAMSLMQDALVFSPTVQIQHSRLVSRNGVAGTLPQTLPLDFASYQIQTGRLEEAVETLERGRALLWSEMRGLRTSVDQVRAADSALAEKFATINQKLEAVTMSVAAADVTSGTDNRRDGATDGLDAFGRLVLQQRKLLEDRNLLISEIQNLPGFQAFLKTPSFVDLQAVASHGPVIIINHSQWRSDIVILHDNSTLSHIPTSDDFYHRASGLADTLLSVRKDNGVDSDEYNSVLASVLVDLYQLVGDPVMERLRELNIPEQSRVWWCPTSVFCSLPLHAMGPVPSDDGDEQYFSDFYICSYTQTLSVLIESRKLSSQALERPSILLAAEFDVPDSGESLSDVCEDVEVIQALKTQVTSLISKDATPVAVLEGLQSHRFAHFVCHGTLETGEPFNARFELHGGQRLTLLDIIRSRLPAAEFAFLSACHTAELTEESVADEGLHLVAAVQYCGFRSVVGTMWAMANTDGKELAKHFYKSMLSGKQTGVPYYQKSAKALRDAAKKLRRKRGITLERWVNFVHYGA